MHMRSELLVLRVAYMSNEPFKCFCKVAPTAQIKNGRFTLGRVPTSLYKLRLPARGVHAALI